MTDFTMVDYRKRNQRLLIAASVIRIAALSLATYSLFSDDIPGLLFAIVLMLGAAAIRED